MLVVVSNIKSFYWTRGDPVDALDYHGEVIVVFDPSKTNMAVVVGTPNGDIIGTIEFSGNNRKRGPVMDTTLYCTEVKSYLSRYLSNCKVYMAAEEQAIMPAKGDKAANYKTSMVLTEIRAAILSFFLETYNIKCLEINNWSWKFAVLPEGYRGKFEKGSKRYFCTYFPESPYSHYFEADMTDCICIYRYVVKQYCSAYMIYCSVPEDKLSDYQFGLVKQSLLLPNERQVTLNPNYSLEKNMNYYANRLFGVFTLLVDPEYLEISDIYGHVTFFDFDAIGDEKVKVVVSRK